MRGFNVYYYWSPEKASFEVTGKRAIGDIAEGLHIVELNGPLSDKQQSAVERIRIINPSLTAQPELIQSLFFEDGDEFRLVKTGLHRLLQNLKPRESVLDNLRRRRVERLLSRLVTEKELG